MEPGAAYDLWSSTYDQERDNLLVDLDERLFTRLLERISLQGKVVVDVGCGTGRHWAKLMAKEPARLIGYDTSAGMLARLREKYPLAEVHRVDDHQLQGLPRESCDVVASTLALGHISDVAAALGEWARVMKPGGHALITDLHPKAAALSRCTFEHRGTVHAVRLHVHPLTAIQDAARANQLTTVGFEVAPVDDTSREYFAARNALDSYERVRGVPFIYGLHLRKA